MVEGEPQSRRTRRGLGTRAGVAFLACVAAVAGSAIAIATPASGATSSQPVRVYSFQEDLGTEQVAKDGLALAQKAINAQKTFGDRKVEIVTCKTKIQAVNAMQACARKAADDPQTVAVVANNSTMGAVTDPILQQAGLACLGCQLFS